MGKKHKKHKSEKHGYEEYGEKPLKIVLKVSGNEVTTGSSSLDTFYGEQTADSDKPKDKKKKKKKDKDRSFGTPEDDKGKKKMTKKKKGQDGENDDREQRRTPIRSELDKLEAKEQTPLQEALNQLIRQLQRKDPSAFFSFPVTDLIAPGYSLIIKRPMDFSTMKEKVKKECYRSLDELKMDFRIMCENAMIYNKPETIYHKAARKLLHSGMKILSQVERLPLLIDSPKKLDHQLSSDPDKTPVSNAANTDSEPEDMSQPEKDKPKLTCEYCGWVDFAYTFKGSKRFCSVVCAKRYNVGCTKRIGLFRPERNKPANRWRRSSQGRSSIEAKKQKLSSPQQTQGGSVSSPHASQPSQEESSPCSDMSSYEEPPSPLSAASSGPLGPTPASAQVPVHRQPSRASDQEGCGGRDTSSLCERFLPNDPAKWNVEEVYEFIRSLPGCQEIADEFRSQEIDGQALLLLKEDHLMSTMNIKLGPALKIFARINMLKDS